MSVTDTSQKEVVYWTNLKRVILLWPTEIRDLLTRKKVALNISPLCKGTFPIKGANGVGVEEGMLRSKRKSPWTKKKKNKTDITASITCCS